jgi:hypothetical protein
MASRPLLSMARAVPAAAPMARVFVPAARAPGGIHARGAFLRLLSTSPASSSSPSAASNAVLAALVAVAGYCGYQAYSVLADWPEPCQELVSLAQSDAGLVSAMGGGTITPSRLFWGGSLKQDSVKVRIPLSGRDGTKAELYGAVVRTGGKWVVVNAEVHFATAPPSASRAPSSSPSSSSLSPAAASAVKEQMFGPGVDAVYNLLGGKGGGPGFMDAEKMREVLSKGGH